MTRNPSYHASASRPQLVRNQEAAEAAALASVHLHALKEDDLITWREGLPEDLKVTTKQRFVNDLRPH
jgi:hypothetical protein